MSGSMISGQADMIQSDVGVIGQGIFVDAIPDLARQLEKSTVILVSRGVALTLLLDSDILYAS